eukprot:10383166-Alexandrium_andersonii.AAC.1
MHLAHQTLRGGPRRDILATQARPPLHRATRSPPGSHCGPSWAPRPCPPGGARPGGPPGV